MSFGRATQPALNEENGTTCQLIKNGTTFQLIKNGMTFQLIKMNGQFISFSSKPTLASMANAFQTTDI